jgi:hypothetical protein
MAEIITKLVVDCSTGVTTEVPLTEEELAQRETDAAAAAAEQAEREAAEAAAAEAKAGALAELKALGLSDAAIAALTA